MTAKYYIILFMCVLQSLITEYSFSQNLLFDGDFEEMTGCPKGPKGSCTGNQTLGYLKYWYPVNPWEADYFNKCQRLPDSTDNKVNMLEIGEPQNGNGFIGITATTFKGHSRDANNATYAMSELTTPLQAGKTYHIEFYARLSEESPLAIANLGLYFSVDRPPFIARWFSRFHIDGIHVEPQFENKTIINDVENWTKIEGDIVANGGEKFIVVGNFRDNDKVNWMYTDPEKKTWTRQFNAWSYYFIDNMTIYEVENNKMEIEMKSGQPFILQNILFDVDSYVIQSSFYIELNKLYMLLDKDKDLSIEISGHSDNTGTSVYNNELSLYRAEAIKYYLVKKGISEERIVTKGYGSSIPKGNNETEEGRFDNRRIEIRFNK